MMHIYDGSWAAWLFWAVMGVVVLGIIVITVLTILSMCEPTDSEWEAEKEWRRTRGLESEE